MDPVVALTVVPVLLLAAALAVAVGVLRARWIVGRVHGRSMAPALRDGERVLADRRRRPVRGDVVLLNRPPWGTAAGPAGVARSRRHDGAAEPPRHLVKRVVALAGDELAPALAVPGLAPGRRVPEGHVVVLGDDHDAGGDSRAFGPVPLAEVVGVVRRRLAGPARPAADDAGSSGTGSGGDGPVPLRDELPPDVVAHLRVVREVRCG
jgi:signal peptidase I